MRAKWTGRVVGEMHVYGIKQRELAEAAGMTNAYCGMILTGKREPKGGRERIEAALRELVEARS